MMIWKIFVLCIRIQNRVNSSCYAKNYLSCFCPTFPILQQPSSESSSDSSTLPKLEEFYISLIQSQQSAEGSQFEPSSTQTQAKQTQLPPAAFSATPTGMDSPEKHSGSGRFTYNWQIRWFVIYLFQNITWKIADFSICLKSLRYSGLNCSPLFCHSLFFFFCSLVGGVSFTDSEICHFWRVQFCEFWHMYPVL